jgi:hypothetical protein
MNETHALRISPGSATSASAVASKEEPRLIRARPAGRPREQPQRDRDVHQVPDQAVDESRLIRAGEIEDPAGRTLWNDWEHYCT